MLRSVANYCDLTDTRDLGWHLFTGVLRQLIGSICKGKTILEEWWYQFYALLLSLLENKVATKTFGKIKKLKEERETPEEIRKIKKWRERRPRFYGKWNEEINGKVETTEQTGKNGKVKKEGQTTVLWPLFFLISPLVLAANFLLHVSIFFLVWWVSFLFHIFPL